MSIVNHMRIYFQTPLIIVLALILTGCVTNPKSIVVFSETRGEPLSNVMVFISERKN